MPATVPNPQASCSLTIQASSQKLLTFQRCAALEPGFSLLWNVTASEGSGGNATLSLAFQAQHHGWAGFGFSQDGRHCLLGT